MLRPQGPGPFARKFACAAKVRRAILFSRSAGHASATGSGTSHTGSTRSFTTVSVKATARNAHIAAGTQSAVSAAFHARSFRTAFCSAAIYLEFTLRAAGASAIANAIVCAPGSRCGGSRRQLNAQSSTTLRCTCSAPSFTCAFAANAVNAVSQRTVRVYLARFSALRSARSLAVSRASLFATVLWVWIHFAFWHRSARTHGSRQIAGLTSPALFLSAAEPIDARA